MSSLYSDIRISPAVHEFSERFSFPDKLIEAINLAVRRDYGVDARILEMFGGINHYLEIILKTSEKPMCFAVTLEATGPKDPTANYKAMEHLGDEMIEWLLTNKPLFSTTKIKRVLSTPMPISDSLSRYMLEDTAITKDSILHSIKIPSFKTDLDILEKINKELKSRGNFKINITALVDLLFKLDVIIEDDKEDKEV